MYVCIAISTNIVILSFTTNVFINSVISFHSISKICIDSIIYFLTCTTIMLPLLKTSMNNLNY